MTQTLELDVARELTDAERDEVRAYARKLAARDDGGKGQTRRPRIDVEKFYGIFAGIGDGKSVDEMIREAWDEQLSKYDDLFERADEGEKAGGDA